MKGHSTQIALCLVLLSSGCKREDGQGGGGVDATYSGGSAESTNASGSAERRLSGQENPPRPQQPGEAERRNSAVTRPSTVPPAEGGGPGEVYSNAANPRPNGARIDQGGGVTTGGKIFVSPFTNLNAARTNGADAGAGPRNRDTAGCYWKVEAWGGDG